MQRVEDWDYDFAPLSAAALPTELFATERTLKVNNATLAMKYYDPAHTDSDISVRFTEADRTSRTLPFLGWKQFVRDL